MSCYNPDLNQSAWICCRNALGLVQTVPPTNPWLRARDWDARVLANIPVNTLRPRQNGHHFADDTVKFIFVNENVKMSIKISLKFVPWCPINNIPALIQTMTWRRPGDKPLFEAMMVISPTHICVTRPQWVNNRCNYVYIPWSQINCASKRGPILILTDRHSIRGGTEYALAIDEFNTLRPRQNGRHFPDDSFKWIFVNEMYEYRLTFHWSLFLWF